MSDLPGTFITSSGLIDRLAIREVAERYFFGLDAHDHATLATCFATDVAFEFNVGKKFVVQGRQALMEKIGGVARFTSNHTLSNMSIRLHGDTAESITYATAHLLVSTAAGHPVMIRGLRYDDKWVRVDGDDGPVWQIRERIHQPLWQYDAVTVSTALPGRD